MPALDLRRDQDHTKGDQVEMPGTVMLNAPCTRGDNPQCPHGEWKSYCSVCIVSAVAKALRQNGHRDLVDAYVKEATAGDYDNLLRVTMEYVNIE